MKYTYFSTVLKYRFWISVLYMRSILQTTFTSPHLKDKYRTFHFTSFLSKFLLLLTSSSESGRGFLTFLKRVIADDSLIDITSSAYDAPVRRSTEMLAANQCREKLHI